MVPHPFKFLEAFVNLALNAALVHNIFNNVHPIQTVLQPQQQDIAVAAGLLVSRPKDAVIQPDNFTVLFLGKPEALDMVMVHWLTLSSLALILVVGIFVADHARAVRRMNPIQERRSDELQGQVTASGGGEKDSRR